jgi:hypothetical protein
MEKWRDPDGLIRFPDGRVFNELKDENVSSERSFFADFAHHARFRPSLDFVGGNLFMVVARMEYNAQNGLMEYVPWIVNSARELFPLTAAELVKRGLYSKVPLGGVLVHPRYSRSMLKEFLEDGRDGDLLATFRIILTTLEECIQLRDRTAYVFLTLWIMGTYVFEIFDAYPYIHLNGPKAVGKTTALEFLSEVCFNGMLLSSTSASAQFRLVPCFSPTLLIDESEQFHRKGTGELRSILLSGYQKGGGTMRSVQTAKGWTPVWFDVYCPRGFASQLGFEDVLASRTVKIRMTRANRNLGKLDKATAQDVRDACFLMAMTYASDIHDIYETIADSSGIVPFSGRDYQLFRPLLALATATGNANIVREATEFAIASQSENLVDFQESSIEHTMLSFLLEAVGEDGEYRGDILLKNFEEYVGRNDIELSKPMTPKSQGEILASLGLLDRKAKKRSSDRKTRLYPFQRRSIVESARAYHLLPPA